MAFKVREVHWHILLEAMEANPVLATGKFIGPNGKETYKKIWNETVDKLNALGYGTRTTEKWQKTWSDYKYSLKKKAAYLKQKLGATGGGPVEKDELSELELRILDILGEHFLGLNEPELGVPSVLQSQSENPVISVRVTLVTPATAKRKIDEQPSTSKRLKESDYSKDYKATIDELKDIKFTMKNSLGEICTTLKEIASEIRQFNDNILQVLNVPVDIEYEQI